MSGGVGAGRGGGGDKFDNFRVVSTGAQIVGTSWAE